MTREHPDRRGFRIRRRGGLLLAGPLTIGALVLAVGDGRATEAGITPGVTPQRERAPAPDKEPARAVDAPASPDLQTANGPRKAVRDVDRVSWHASVPVGQPSNGSLRRAVRLPAHGQTFVSWDPVRRQRPNAPDRRYATARLVRALLEVAALHAKTHPDAPRIVVGDLSRQRGGDFGARFGDLGDGEGHVSHQNGLDVDVYYPRRDGRESGPRQGGPQDIVAIDRALSQALVDRFVAAGAQAIFVGTATGLTGPRGVVTALPRHNDHLHVRFAGP